MLPDVLESLRSHRASGDLLAQIVSAARNAAGADGATLVLRDLNHCYYADENAISPLWKGRRFHLNACISGWVMLNKVPAVIPDIYMDIRIPLDAYRPTFVKSLAMVPVGRETAVAAIGNYWASKHEASDRELTALQALADTVGLVLDEPGLLAELRSHVSRAPEPHRQHTGQG